jgi:thioredoxin-dependent peroxiredoxin
MTRLARLLLISFLVGLPSLASAGLKVGTMAPPISAKAALGGAELTFALSEALKKGPVVVYFYPKSFTSVCTEEAHLFAEAMPEFEKLGASVIGISTDTIETQREFSSKECRDKFPVAADPKGDVVRAYNVLGWKDGRNIYASRTSYVIAPDGKIASVLTADDAASHIQSALKSVKAWKAHPGQ